MRRHFTFANVVSSTALFFALCGGSYAAVSADQGEQAPEAPLPAPTVVTPVEVTDAPAPVPVAESPAAAPEVAPAASPAPSAPLTPAAEAAAPPKQAVGAVPAERDSVEREDVGGGPPPWAPAYGYRCQQEAAPGSDAFHACIESSKP